MNMFDFGNGWMRTSLRDDLIAFMEQAGKCEGSPPVVTATMEMARSHPDLFQTLTERFRVYVRTELQELATRSAETGHEPLERKSSTSFPTPSLPSWLTTLGLSGNRFQ
ncbi:MAG: hypothetical protein AAGC76_19390 [Luteibacter sp.]|uniref:hypothetical protein n=1 Tax=Luteibacter sp. TaxID=1886636 RepID=UPI002808D948|nr:hypothetical protein [Luteibacter sp.]MDQ7998011.1 hypothetical protein [Luteibacter sp.]